MAWVVGIVIAAAFWLLSAQSFVDHWNHVPLVQQLGLNFRTVFVQIGVVALMFPVIDMLFLKPLRAALDARTKYLEDTYSEAESLKQRMADLKTSYEQKLAASEAEARTKIQAAIAEAQQMKDQIMAEAREQAAEIRERTAEDMQREREKMLVELRSHVVELTLSATERLIGENLDDERQRRLVAEFIEKAEVGH